MTECWSEGALRAYLDRELPTEDMQRVAAHLVECTACDNLCTELAGRADHVSAMMDLLPEWSAPAARPAMVAGRRVGRISWVGIAVAVAACLALAVYLRPDPPVTKAVLAPAAVPAVAVPVPAEPLTETVTEAVTEPRPAALTARTVEAPVRYAPRRARTVRQPDPEHEYFVALDDEPFESGVIMRVDVKPGNVQADIVFGPDGRARGFRMVNAKQRY